MRLRRRRDPPLPGRLAPARQRPRPGPQRQTPLQRVTSTYRIAHTFLQTFSIPPDKKAKLTAFLETFFDLRECSLHDLASLRGRIQHYSAC